MKVRCLRKICSATVLPCLNRPRFVICIMLMFGIIYFCLDKHLAVNLNPNEYTLDNGIKRKQPIKWQYFYKTNSSTMNCRNSMQGSQLIVDERGFICQRAQLLLNGCCNTSNTIPDTVSYPCHSCSAIDDCCGIFEYCVSCCLRPEKRALLEEVLLNAKKQQQRLFALVEDQFELCLVKCRTNSDSVVHENVYKNANRKYCYGKSS